METSGMDLVEHNELAYSAADGKEEPSSTDGNPAATQQPNKTDANGLLPSALDSGRTEQHLACDDTAIS